MVENKENLVDTVDDMTAQSNQPELKLPPIKTEKSIPGLISFQDGFGSADLSELSLSADKKNNFVHQMLSSEEQENVFTAKDTTNRAKSHKNC